MDSIKLTDDTAPTTDSTDWKADRVLSFKGKKKEFHILYSIASILD